LPGLRFLDLKDDLFPYMRRAKIVYTSALSETATYAVSLGKKISPYPENPFQAFWAIIRAFF
jgi:hypothetical protein